MIRQLIRGGATFVPGARRFIGKGTGGTDLATYCYSVWLRHLVMARNNGLNPHPETVAELGPGDSLGIGLAALLSGVERYFAFDIVDHANAERNLKIFDELVTLFSERAAIPGSDAYPGVKPSLENYEFPADILSESRLRHALGPSRIEKIRGSIADSHRGDSVIEYKVPWHDASVLGKESVDMIYSQAVLEHVDDLRETYRAMRLWLKPDGYMSHQIDFKSHGTADVWNGHWTYSDFIWKVVRGKRSYLLNREPRSAHIAILKEEGFRVVCEKTVKSESTLTRANLASRFRSMPEDDLTTSDLFFQAVKAR